MKRIICFILVMVALSLSFSAYAVYTYGGYNIPVDIQINGSFIKCAQKPIMVNSSTYIPLRAFSDAICGEITWDETQMAATLTKDGHSFVFYSDMDFCTIDGEAKPYGSVNYKDLLFVPVRAISEVLGYKVEWDDLYLIVKVTASDVAVPETAIDKTYTYDDITYLGKITHIESGYQDFRVRLGVAATVMNRVKSNEFPNTIKDVIFDTKYSVQFPPAHTEKFDKLPSKETVIAAKCVLNGVNIVGNSLYFVDSAYKKDSWVHNNRPHYATIVDMDFYE